MIWIVPIEPIDQRYTKQWYENIPKEIENYGIETRTIGEDTSSNTTTGAFLNFAFTNKYKAKQVVAIAELFENGEISPGDKFLVTDAWNFVITAIKYMSDLLDVPVEIHGIWHAGAYDPSDILGMKMLGESAHHSERSWFHACDYNYFATNFHKDMFLRNLNIDSSLHHKAIRSGQPHKLIVSELQQYIHDEKTDSVIFPHRYNSDKQPEIAESLNLVITQKMNLSKSEYYKLLGSSKAVFSCSLHENLGISMMEGCLAGAIPIVPDRCSYSEMYLDVFKYPSVWTESVENFYKYQQEVKDFVQERVSNYSDYLLYLYDQNEILREKYLSAQIMYDNLLG